MTGIESKVDQLINDLERESAAYPNMRIIDVILMLKKIKEVAALSSLPVQSNKEDAIILALVRCVIATNPNDAISHQIMRLYSNYIETNKKEMADRLHEILNSTNTDNFKLVQSTPSQEGYAGKLFDENAGIKNETFDPWGNVLDVKWSMSREKFIEVLEQLRIPDAGMEKIMSDTWDNARNWQEFSTYPDKDQYIKQVMEVINNSKK